MHLSTLILMRHGQSAWNGESRFTGWVDVALSAVGHDESVLAGRQIGQAGLIPDVVHTSLLRRATSTAEILLDVVGRPSVPLRKSWRLNERHYGALQGRSKTAVREEVGDEQFNLWRRSFDVAPPAIEDLEQTPFLKDPRYSGLGDEVPRAESLRDVSNRLLPYWENSILPDLRRGATVLVVAHSNSLRALVKHLDGLSDEAISDVNLPTGKPFVYELNGGMRPIRPGGYYLDPATALDEAEAVSREGCVQPA